MLKIEKYWPIRTILGGIFRDLSPSTHPFGRDSFIGLSNKRYQEQQFCQSLNWVVKIIFWRLPFKIWYRDMDSWLHDFRKNSLASKSTNLTMEKGFNGSRTHLNDCKNQWKWCKSRKTYPNWQQKDSRYVVKKPSKAWVWNWQNWK